MASKRAAVPAKHLFNGFRAYDQPTRCFARSMTTATTEPPSDAAPILDANANATLSKAHSDATLDSAPTQPILEDKVSIPPPPPAASRSSPKIQIPAPFQPQKNPFAQTAQCTLYNFPFFAPTSFVKYPGTHLMLPLRKDILHRALIFEGDATRQGSANTKWRSEIHGSNRKVRPQKGTGSARLGNKKSPMLRGGGVAFGPKPRDFSTDLPQKVYDLAWRTALSYRYRRGELIVVENELDVQGIPEGSLERYVKTLVRVNNVGRSLFLTMERRDGLFTALEGEGMGRYARAEEVAWVDVKDLLEGERLVVERAALETMFKEHESDLPTREKWRRQMSELRVDTEKMEE